MTQIIREIPDLLQNYSANTKSDETLYHLWGPTANRIAPSVNSTWQHYINCLGDIPLAIGAVSYFIYNFIKRIFFDAVSFCQLCLTNIVFGFLKFGSTSVVLTVVGIWIITVHYGFLKHQITNLISTLYSDTTYQPIFISVLTTFVLNPSTQTFLLNYFNTFNSNPWWLTFLFLFWWKAVKIIIQTYSYVFLTEANLYRPALNPKYSPEDVTVIIPTVGNICSEFKKCITSILKNSPGQIIVTTAELPRLKKAQETCEQLEKDVGVRKGTIIVTSIVCPNKREQVIQAVKRVATHIICFADDHIFWPTTFLQHALAPFEDPLVGLVGTVKRVERKHEGGFLGSLLNYIAVIYLERHNFECTATYNLDGGVFVISSRSALTRTEIMHSREYRQGFLNEKWLWGKVGPMKVDDDNYTTRFMVNHGYKTVFHNEEAALMKTSLGTEGGVEKFSGQLMRWVRTTWRSNCTSLFAERTVWRRHPWTTYAMMISLFFNISLIYDSLLFFTLFKSGYMRQYWGLLILFLVISKTIKQIPHLARNNSDIRFWIPGMLFGYVHSLFKLYALFTASNIEWTGRSIDLGAMESDGDRNYRGATTWVGGNGTE